jgi:acetoin utilization deacetylase AcuC-like enzyme
MAAVGIVHHLRCLDHDTGAGHPEHAGRLEVILDRLEQSGLLQDLDRLTPEPLDDAALELIHPPEYVAHVAETCARGPVTLDNWDVPVSAASDEAARLAAGGMVQAVDKVMDGSWRRAFVAVRPPGHHAERREAMGFCIYNNVAITARHLQRRHGLERIAIVDFDVHHGNGTQHLFEEDPTVFYASLHQFPHYPGTGRATERGRGDGEGATLNCPLTAGTGDREWIVALEDSVVPALERFRPDFLLVSAGFDAHRRDPLSNTLVTEEGYRRMTAALQALAADRCAGRMVSILEGGYDLGALASSVETHCRVLVGE